MNELLRAARERLPSPARPGERMSRQELADLVNDLLFGPQRSTLSGFDANYVGKLERGKIQYPTEDYRAALRNVLRVGSDEELGFRAPRIQRVDRPVRSADSGSSMARRDELTDPSLTTAVNADRAWPIRSAEVDPSLVLHWMNMLNVLASSHNVFGPQRIHNAASREAAIIRRYRQESSGEVRSGFLALEARWAEFASWTAENLGAQEDATYWLDRAYALARRAGHSLTASYVQMRQAQQAADRRDSDATLALAAKAKSDSSMTERDQALCCVRLAQGHALAGNYRASKDAIGLAHRLVAKADDTGADESPRTIGRHCNPPYVWAHEGYCLLRLGEMRAAVKILKGTLAAWPTHYRQDKGLARAWLAHSYAGCGRPSEAGAEAVRALTSTTGAESARTMRVLGQLKTRLSDRMDVPEVREFLMAYQIAEAARRM